MMASPAHSVESVKEIAATGAVDTDTLAVVLKGTCTDLLQCKVPDAWWLAGALVLDLEWLVGMLGAVPKWVVETFKRDFE